MSDDYSDSEGAENVTNPLTNVKIESNLNKDDGSFPWGYYNPNPQPSFLENMTWTCSYDAKNNLTSVFCVTDKRVANTDNRKQKSASYLEDGDHEDQITGVTRHFTREELAANIRDKLVLSGWKKLAAPKIEFTMPDEKGIQRPLNRKQRRYLERKVRQGYDITKLHAEEHK
jgi:hypothetical protein